MSYKAIYMAERQSKGRARQYKNSVGQSNCLGRMQPSARQFWLSCWAWVDDWMWFVDYIKIENYPLN